jgi:hypothetical protein
MYSKCPSLGIRSTRRSVSAQTSASTRSGENPAALRGSRLPVSRSEISRSQPDQFRSRDRGRRYDVSHLG